MKNYNIWIVYQTRSENTKKIECPDRIDAVLSFIKSIWESSIILTGDTYIDLKSRSVIGTTGDMRHVNVQQMKIGETSDILKMK